MYLYRHHKQHHIIYGIHSYFMPNICYSFYNPYNDWHQYKFNIPALTGFLVGGCNLIWKNVATWNKFDDVKPCSLPFLVYDVVGSSAFITFYIIRLDIKTTTEIKRHLNLTFVLILYIDIKRNSSFKLVMIIKYLYAIKSFLSLRIYFQLNT